MLDCRLRTAYEIEDVCEELSKQTMGAMFSTVLFKKGKIVMKKVISVVMVIAILFSFAACGGGGGKDEPVVGNWQLTGANFAGQEITIDDFESIGMGDTSIELKVSGDGKFTMSVTAFGESESESGKWSKNGDSYELDLDGEVQTVTINSDGNLIMEESGVELIFSK